MVTKPPIIHPVTHRMATFLVWKLVHGSLSRAVHDVVLCWSSPVGAKLTMLVLFYVQALCHLPCRPRVSYGMRLPAPTGLVLLLDRIAVKACQALPHSALYPWRGIQCRSLTTYLALETL